jgi:hypothetical protein
MRSPCPKADGSVQDPEQTLTVKARIPGRFVNILLRVWRTWPEPYRRGLSGSVGGKLTQAERWTHNGEKTTPLHAGQLRATEVFLLIYSIGKATPEELTTRNTRININLLR